MGNRIALMGQVLLGLVFFVFSGEPALVLLAVCVILMGHVLGGPGRGRELAVLLALALGGLVALAPQDLYDQWDSFRRYGEYISIGLSYVGLALLWLMLAQTALGTLVSRQRNQSWWATTCLSLPWLALGALWLAGRLPSLTGLTLAQVVYVTQLFVPLGTPRGLAPESKPALLVGHAFLCGALWAGGSAGFTCLALVAVVLGHLVGATGRMRALIYLPALVLGFALVNSPYVFLSDWERFAGSAYGFDITYHLEGAMLVGWLALNQMAMALVVCLQKGASIKTIVGSWGAWLVLLVLWALGKPPTLQTLALAQTVFTLQLFVLLRTEREGVTARFCGACSLPAFDGDQFCGGCGSPLS